MDKQTCCPSECPVAGDFFVCGTCGFSVLVVRPCTCTDCECVALACCGTAMGKAN